VLASLNHRLFPLCEGGADGVGSDDGLGVAEAWGQLNLVQQGSQAVVDDSAVDHLAMGIGHDHGEFGTRQVDNELVQYGTRGLDERPVTPNVGIE
jgi:hypothetical protein